MRGATIRQHVGAGPTRLRLDSWKEIATYLKRGVRTVRRWEHQEGLPAHRHLHGTQGTVYAFADEIDKWLRGRSVEKGADQLPADQVSRSAAGPDLDTLRKGLRNRPAVIAVLPLRNLGGNPEKERFADGLTEELISELGHCCPDRLRVIALTSVIQYKQSAKSIRQIGQELGADYILEGGIRRYEQRVRLTARLIASRDQAHIWADSYEIQLPPIFSLQQALARQVAHSLSVKLHATPKKKGHRTTVLNFAAHSAYIEGRSHFLPTPGDSTKSIEYLNLAIAQDPKFAASYAQLALAYFRRLFWDYPPIVTFRRIEENASKALKLNPQLARAHSMLAAFHLFSAWAWSKADEETHRAIKLNPSDAWAHIVRGAYHLVVGQIPQAIAALRLVRQLDPQSQETGIWFAHFAYFAGRHELAIEHGQEILRLDPSSAFVHMVLGLNFAQIGEYAQAISHCEKAMQLEAGCISLTSRACSIYALAGERQSAQRLFQELVEAKEREYARFIFMAQASACLGKDQQTFEWLEKAFEQRDPMLVFLKTDPRFEPFVGLGHFRNLIRRIGLPSDSRRLAVSQAV
jgi:TolB-like protein/Tfp pilus assembly protein PilF